jgi:5-methylcytosine-specific restriction endonuclease McrA
METKICSKCKRELPRTEGYFYKKKGSKDGYRNDCKECSNKRNKENYYKSWNERQSKNKKYAQLHKDEIAKYQSNYQSENKEQLGEYHKKYSVEYRAKNKETLKNNWARYYSANKEKVLKYHSEHYKNPKIKNSHREWLKEWRKTNADKTQVYKLKRRTLAKDLPSSLTSDDWTKCKKFFNNKCAYCGTTKELTLDHFIAVSKGGGLSKSNAIPACRSCNSSKQDKDFFAWFFKQKFYSKRREQKILKYLNYDAKTQYQQLAL